MKLKINTAAIDSNIRLAEEIADIRVSIMLKSFYEYIYTSEMKKRKVFSSGIEGSICYSIGDARKIHSAAVVTSVKDFQRCYLLGIRRFYVPINAYDNREGMNIPDVIDFAAYIRSQGDFKIFGMITSGCINPFAPSISEIQRWWHNGLSSVLNGISLGGSFYIAALKEWFDESKQVVVSESGAVATIKNSNPPNFITDIRIGEYALFGTIPYSNNPALNGENALTVDMEVVGVHRERGEIVVKGGYSQIDTANCTLLSGGLTYVDTSSEYTIYSDPFKLYNVGDVIEVVPDYYSLVKLQYVERVFV